MSTLRAAEKHPPVLLATSKKILQNYISRHMQFNCGDSGYSSKNNDRKSD